ncbi:unnamed protein product [Symbiodinium pilosum]|uniref:K Homology domain-containing protein n=1 Tax=Symbiodinium pilosum TaxID=2952 RepID=A0A812PA95_SYMPI|nr:unnamed protein product [Symbiodinium pilosum]
MYASVALEDDDVRPAVQPFACQGDCGEKLHFKCRMKLILCDHACRYLGMWHMTDSAHKYIGDAMKAAGLPAGKRADEEEPGLASRDDFVGGVFLNVRFRSGEVKALRAENLDEAEVAGGHASQKAAPTQTAESLKEALEDPPLLEIWSRHRENSERAKAAKKILGGIDAPLKKLDLSVPPELLEQAKRSGGPDGGVDLDPDSRLLASVQDERIALDDLDSAGLNSSAVSAGALCSDAGATHLCSVLCGAAVRAWPKTTVVVTGGVPEPHGKTDDVLFSIAGPSNKTDKQDSGGDVSHASAGKGVKERLNPEKRAPEPEPEKPEQPEQQEKETQGIQGPRSLFHEARRPRRSKWDDRGPPLQGDGNSPSTETLPDWLKDLEGPISGKPIPQLVVPGPTTSRSQLPNLLGQRHKTMMLKAVQIRVLLGRGGETIKSICERANAEIKVDHDRVAEEGEVTIVGEIEKAEALIRETLAAKGCPLPEDEARQPDETDLVVPPDVVGLFIGKGGEHVKAIREACGGSLFIGVIAPIEGNGPHKIQIIGDQREKAKAMVRQRLKELRESEDMKSRSLDVPVATSWQGLATPQSFGPSPGQGGMLRPNSPLSPLPPGRIPLRAPVPNLPIRPAAPITPMVPLNPVSTPGAFSGAHGRPVVRPRAQAAPTAPQGPSPSTPNHPNLNNIPPAQRLLAQATSLGDIHYRLILHRKIRKLGSDVFQPMLDEGDVEAEEEAPAVSRHAMRAPNKCT